jgi:hypothetical protein
MIMASLMQNALSIKKAKSLVIARYLNALRLRLT